MYCGIGLTRKLEVSGTLHILLSPTHAYHALLSTSSTFEIFLTIDGSFTFTGRCYLNIHFIHSEAKIIYILLGAKITSWLWLRFKTTYLYSKYWENLMSIIIYSRVNKLYDTEWHTFATMNHIKIFYRLIMNVLCK